MPDDELFKLAGEGKLRQNLDAQVKRMLADPRSKAFVENFAGQWLQSRDVLNADINRTEVMALEGVKTSGEVTAAQRDAMKEEAADCFDYVARGDRSVLELLDSDYTFLNETLAKFYGIPDVTGPQMRKVTLPPGDPRGGVLTMGSVLEVTSNPTRTSPVKRGKWILENILGSPAPPPPPDVPALDEAVKKIQDHVPTQREALALHRENAALRLVPRPHGPARPRAGKFQRARPVAHQRIGQAVDASGQLMSGESFQNVQELKKILTDNHREEFYRTLTEKLLTYALGRGLEYYDAPTVDKIVERLETGDGHFSALLLGIVESAPFQERRLNPNPSTRCHRLHGITTTGRPMNPNPTKPAGNFSAMNRRRFLRGLGVCMALPAMESFMPRTLFAADAPAEALRATTATGAPLRTAFIYFPNGAIPGSWTPTGEGKDYVLNETMQPLAALKDKIQVFGGLNDLSANARQPTAAATTPAPTARSSPACASRKPAAMIFTRAFPPTKSWRSRSD